MREYGPVGKSFAGDTDAAKTRIGIARTQLGIMKNMMALGGLQQLVRNVKLADGTLIRVQSIFGQDRISITVPPAAAAGEGAAGEMVSAVNTAVDYVGVEMPNPVPYRGVSIGVVAGAVTTYSVSSSSSEVSVIGLSTMTWVLRIVGSDGSSTIFNTVVGTLSSNYAYGMSGMTGTFDISDAVNYFDVNGSVYNGYATYTVINGSVVASDYTHMVGVYYTSTPEYLAAAAQAAAMTAASTTVNPTKTYVMASDGTVLANEVQTTSDGHTYYVPNTAWNGEGYVNMYVDSVAPANLNHQLTFTVPEDCIYPTPSVSSSIFNARRKAWFKKNSDEFIAALKTGFAANAPGVTRAELKTGSLPASWDYQIKKNYNRDYDKGSYKLSDNSFAGHHTKMPIVMSITSAADVVVSDTSANLTQAGTKVTRRTTTFAYTDANGKNRSVPIDGTLTQVVTQHANGWAGLSQVNTYSNWYTLNYPNSSSYVASPWTKTKQQFIGDRSVYSIGMVWSGVESGIGNLVPLFGDSTWNGGPAYTMSYADMVPPWPLYSNTLVGTAPDIFLQYHNTVLPQYVANTAQSSTVMNNSAMYHVTHIELIPFGLVTSEALGIFPDVNEDGTRVEIYGKAVYKFDWSTGALTFQSWNPMRDPNGNIASKTITIPGNYSDAGYNCLVGYVWDSPDQMWPDVEEYLRKKVTAVATTDPILYTLIKEAVAL